MTDKPLTIDTLMAAKRYLELIPPPPLLVSSKRLPAHNAITVKHDRRDYVGAHPDFWERVKRDLRSGPSVSGHRDLDIPIWDIDFHTGRAKEFYEAMGKALGRTV